VSDVYLMQELVSCAGAVNDQGQPIDKYEYCIGVYCPELDVIMFEDVMGKEFVLTEGSFYLDNHWYHAVKVGKL